MRLVPNTARILISKITRFHPLKFSATQTYEYKDIFWGRKRGIIDETSMEVQYIFRWKYF